MGMEFAKIGGVAERESARIVAGQDNSTAYGELQDGPERSADPQLPLLDR